MARSTSPSSELNSPGRGASPTSLAGMGSGSDTGSTSSPSTGSESGDAGMKQVMEQMYGIKTQLLEMAKTFPVAAKSIQAVMKPLGAARREVIGNPSAP